MDDLIERKKVLEILRIIGHGRPISGKRAISLISEIPSASMWIPCSERLPEKDGEYLVFTEYEDVFKCTFDSNYESKWGFEQDYRDPDTLGWAGTTWTAVETVTHWMPLPEPPKE